jgi:hypothetical protein
MHHEIISRDRGVLGLVRVWFRWLVCTTHVLVFCFMALVVQLYKACGIPDEITSFIQ